MKQNAVVRAFVAALTFLIAGLGLVAVAPAASAYDSPLFSISIDNQTVVSGGKFTVTTKADVTCSWTQSFLDQSASGSGTSFAHTFIAPTVTQTTKYPVNASCGYSSVAGAAGHSLKIVDQVWTGQTFVTVTPAGTLANTGGLPNTGGPSIWWLVAGLMALLAGAGLLANSRRGSSDNVAV